jgi:Peptidase family M23
MKVIAALPVLIAFLVGALPAHAWTWPVAGPVLQPFQLGSDPYAAGQHRGIDIGAPPGTAVVTPAGGDVAFAGTVPRGGRTLTIATPDGYAVTLLHLGSIAVARGESVEEGDPIGTIGPSGEAEHAEGYVHLGIRVTDDPHGYVDPASLLPTRPASEPAPETGEEAEAPNPVETPGGEAPAEPPQAEGVPTEPDGGSEVVTPPADEGGAESPAETGSEQVPVDPPVEEEPRPEPAPPAEPGSEAVPAEPPAEPSSEEVPVDPPVQEEPTSEPAPPAEPGSEAVPADPPIDVEPAPAPEPAPHASTPVPAEGEPAQTPATPERVAAEAPAVPSPAADGVTSASPRVAGGPSAQSALSGKEARSGPAAGSGTPVPRIGLNRLRGVSGEQEAQIDPVAAGTVVRADGRAPDEDQPHGNALLVRVFLVAGLGAAALALFGALRASRGPGPQSRPKRDSVAVPTGQAERGSANERTLEAGAATSSTAELDVWLAELLSPRAACRSALAPSRRRVETCRRPAASRSIIRRRGAPVQAARSARAG